MFNPKHKTPYFIAHCPACGHQADMPKVNFIFGHPDQATQNIAQQLHDNAYKPYASEVICHAKPRIIKKIN